MKLFYISDYRLLFTDFRLPITDYRLQITDYRLFFFHSLYILLFFFFSPTLSYSQTSEIRGFVYEEKSREPVIFTNVYLSGTTIGSTTDVNGYFSITKVPPGKYKLFVSYIGFDTLKSDVDLKLGQILTKQLFLKEQIQQLETVEIKDTKTQQRVEVRTSVSSISVREITQLPSVGGAPDVAQFLQTLPGVIFTGDQGGRLYIRGGAPVQNKVLLDGMTIYNPFHSIGLFSVFDVDVIRNIDVYTGGFNAEHGGRISAVMDITTRDGNKNRRAGNLSVNPFTSKLMLEGPFLKSEPGKGGASYIMSARTSYLETTSKQFYSYANKTGLPYNFTDLYGKASLASSSGSKLNLFGFNFSDRVNFQTPLNLGWNSYGVGSNFILLPSANSVIITGNFAYSNFRIDIGEQSYQPKHSEIDGFNLGLDFTYFIKQNQLKYGFEVNGSKTDFRTFSESGLRYELVNYSTDAGAFVTYRIVNDKFVLEPGMRFHYYESSSELSPEPRLGMKVILSRWLRFKIAGGLFSQNIIGTDTDRDVVNLFSGYISEPEDLKTEEGKEVKSRLQKARHIVSGFEIDITDDFEVNIEPYYKYFNQLINVRRNRILSEKSVFVVETGNAKGLDFLFKYDFRRFYCWLSYSIGYVERFIGDVKYYPNYDRRHNINFILAYKFGRASSWETSIRWNYGSGFPYTPTQGYYESFTFDEGLDTDLLTQNGNMGVNYAELNTKRLPDYHRLDLLIKKKIALYKNSALEISAGATNVYNRDNIFYVNRASNSIVKQLPIMPNVGMNWIF